MATIEHGTQAGYQQCRKRPEGSCTPCRAANAAYLADYRRRFPGKYAVERAKSNARHRALWRLAHLYHAQFRVLVEEETSRGEVAS